jgi:hypothetical protein
MDQPFIMAVWSKSFELDHTYKYIVGVIWLFLYAMAYERANLMGL